METSESKLSPELRRWIQKDSSHKRTVIIRLAFSQNPEEASEILGKMGMDMQSHGPNVVIAASDSASVVQASQMPWVIRIDLPQQLNMKSISPTI